MLGGGLRTDFASRLSEMGYKHRRLGTRYLGLGTEGTMAKIVSGTWAIGQVLLDDYEGERRLGHGGMGAVYLVRSLSSNRRLAVKTILESRLGDEASRRNFLAELQTWID